MNGKRITIICISVLLCTALVLGIIIRYGKFEVAKAETENTVPTTKAVTEAGGTETTSSEETSAEPSEDAATTTATTAAAPETAATTVAATEKTTEAATTVKSNNFTAAPAVVNCEQAMLDALNAERVKNGLSMLSMMPELNACAQVRAREIIEKTDHTRPNGTSPFTALSEGGIAFSTAGENIAAGQLDAAEVTKDWMNSEGHRENILHAGFTRVGLACVYLEGSKYGYYWVQLFVG